MWPLGAAPWLLRLTASNCHLPPRHHAQDFACRIRYRQANRSTGARHLPGSPWLRPPDGYIGPDVARVSGARLSDRWIDPRSPARVSRRGGPAGPVGHDQPRGLRPVTARMSPLMWLDPCEARHTKPGPARRVDRA